MHDEYFDTSRKLSGLDDELENSIGWWNSSGDSLSQSKQRSNFEVLKWMKKYWSEGMIEYKDPS